MQLGLLSPFPFRAPQRQVGHHVERRHVVRRGPGAGLQATDARRGVLLGPSQAGDFVKDWLYTHKDQQTEGKADRPGEEPWPDKRHDRKLFDAAEPVRWLHRGEGPARARMTLFRGLSALIG